jgi:predicted alpha/beta-hydrolase family hydrolase
MGETKMRIEVAGAGVVTGVRTEASARGGGARGGGGAGWVVVYAPGAGANLGDPFGAELARVLPGRGVSVVRFQFPYMEAGRKSPDRPAVLEETWRAVVEAVRAEDGGGGRGSGRGRASGSRSGSRAGSGVKVCLAGRSMGGRIASMVVADGVRAEALALFAYPLHPPGKPEQARTEHLSRIKMPTLFVSGTRDAFGSPEELRSAAKLVRGSRTHFLEHADHGFSAPKSSGRTRADVHAEAAEVLAEFLLGLG